MKAKVVGQFKSQPRKFSCNESNATTFGGCDYCTQFIGVELDKHEKYCKIMMCMAPEYTDNYVNYLSA